MANTPSPGQLVDGYRFKGGDPADQNNWELALPKAGEIVDGFRFKGGDPGVETSWEKLSAEPGLLDRAKQGLSSTTSAIEIAATNDPNKIAQTIAQGERTRLPQSPTQAKMAEEIRPYAEDYQKSQGLDAVGSFAKLAAKRLAQFVQNPGETVGAIVENLPNSAPGLAGGAAGAVAGAATPVPGGAFVGGVVGGTAGGYAVEQGAAMRDQVLKEAVARNVDPRDPVALEPIIREKYSEFLEKSRLKGIGTAGTDAVLNAVTFGLAGAGERAIVRGIDETVNAARAGTITAEQAAKQLGELEARQAARMTLPARAGRGAAITGSEMIGEGVSEAAGQKLAYGQVDPVDVIDESLLGLGQGVGMAASRGLVNRALGSPTRNTIEQNLATAQEQLQTAASASEAAAAASALAGSVDELAAAVDQYLTPPPTITLDDTQLRLEAAALAGQEAARREEDAPRQAMISRAMASIEQRGGVASPYEAELLAAAGMGQPFNTIDPSLGRPASIDEKLTAATGLAVGQEAGVGFGARESTRITSPQAFEYAADLQGRQRTEAAPAPEVTLTQAFVQQMRRTDTPAARAFVQQYDSGRITDADVQSALDTSQRALPQPAQQRLETAAAQAPAPAEGVQVAQELRSRGVSPVLADAVQQYGNLPYTAQDLTVEGATARLERAAPGAQPAPAGIEVANVREQRGEFPGRQEATVNNLPRPSRVGGVLASSLTDEQLRTTAANEGLPAITRRGAQIELLARQQEQRGSTSQPEIESATARLESAATEGRLSQPSSGRIILSGAQLSTQRNLAPGASVAIKDGDTDHQATVVDPGKLGNQGRLLTQIARIFGKRLVAFESATLQADGFVMDNDNRSIFINTKTQISPLAVFGHELTHLLKRDNPKAYAALQAVVEREMGEGAMDRFTQEYGAGANLEELTSDLVGNRFQEADFWQSVFDEIARQNPRDARSIITRLAAAINKAVTAFVRLVRQPGFQADTYVNDVNAIKAAVRDALVDYAQAQREPAMRLETETAQAQSQVDLIGGKPFAYDRNLQGARREIGVPLVGTGERVQASRQRGYNLDNEDDNATQRNEGVSAAAAQDGRRAGADGRREIPSYGTAREGAISVVGRHYSTAERQSLNGSYYGSGLKGAERTRLNDSTDPRLRQRVYFYVDDGAGITPEAGVGGVAHEVRLNNIYEPSSRLIPTQPNINAFESAVINAGFDGYIAPFARQAAVVLLGPKHKAVPVKSIGTVASAAAPQAAAPATLKKGLLSREANAVNVDAIPGARLESGNLEIPAESRDAANAELERIGSPARFSRQRTIDLASLDEANKLAQSRAWPKGRELKVAMQQRVLDASMAAGLDITQDLPETREYLRDVGMRDALVALRQNPNAIGWYDLKTRQALSVMSLVHPEIARDENARFAFTWALAVTSNGLKVGKNFELAEQAYEYYKRNKSMPTNIGIGTAGGQINDALELFNVLRDAWGIDNLRKFMQTNFTVSEITGISKALKPGGEHADVVVKGAAIIGPKIGNGFFSNLYGNFDSLTMDRWLIRTWGRWTGTLIKPMPEQTAKARDRLAANIRQIVADTAEAKRLSELVDVEITGDIDTDVLAGAVQKTSMEPEVRAKLNESEVGLELRKAGNSLAKYLDGQKEAPANPDERKYIRAVFGDILAELKQTNEYKDLTMADLQAVLWYAEKRLYETAKENPQELAADEDVEGYADDEAPDYANAAADVARQKGITDRRINGVLRKVENERSRAAGSAVVPGDAPGQAAGAGQQGTTGGFARQEKRKFIGERAVLRARADRASDAQQPGAYERDSGEDSGRVRVLKSLGVSYTNVWKIARPTSTVFRANDIAAPEFLELARTPENAAKFQAAISENKANLKFGAAVYVYPAEDYQAMRLFLAKDGKSGVAIKPDGDIVSVFSTGGAGRAVMELAVAAGGRKLDAFDTILPEFYAPHGFRAVARTRWNDEFAPDAWNKDTFREFNNGEPDVVFMVYDPAKKDAEYSPRDGRVMQGEDGYDRAVATQSREMRKVQRAAPAGAQLSRQRQIDTPAFKRWFGDSKVVDADGRPLVVYHGTGADFTSFDPERVGEIFNDDSDGFFFSGSAETAGRYANRAAKNRNGEGANIMPVYLSLQKPYTFSDYAFNFAEKDDPNEITSGRLLIDWFDREKQAIMQIAKEDGHDGLYFKRGNEVLAVAFRPEQIKSATGNSGAFDPNNPDITASRRRQIDTPAFQRWFGDSKVVDANGEPLVVYHGTLRDFAAFDRSAPKGSSVPNATDYLGIFFSTSASDAGGYAQQEGANIIPAFLSIKNPMPVSVDKWGSMSNSSKGYVQVRNLLKKATENGNDGFVVKGKTRTWYIAFRPEQIKSATGNSGAFDPNNPDITASRRRNIFGQPAPLANWTAPTESKVDNVIYSMQDKLVDTKRVVETIRAAVGAIDDQWNPYLQEELYHGRTAKATKDFLSDELRPLLQDMQLRKVTMEQLEEYLHNRHAEERNVQIAKVNANMPDGGSGIDTADARAYLAGLSQDDRRNLEALAQRVDAITAGTRQLLVSSGLETQDTIDKWEGAYGKYVPLYREDVDFGASGSGMGTGQGYQVKGAASRRATGSSRPVVDILANVAMQRERAIVRAEKDRVAQALYGLAVKNPNTSFWLAVDPAGQKDPAKAMADLMAMGLDPLDAQNIIEEPVQSTIDLRTGLVVQRVNPLLRSSDNVLAVRINGEEKYVFFNANDERSERMVSALKNLDADQLGRVMSMLGTVTRYFASINTQYNPIFGAVNFMRDVQGAMFNLSTTPIADRTAEVASNTIPALRGIYSDLRSRRAGSGPATGTWATLWEEFQREGGQTGYRDVFSRSEERGKALETELNKITEGKAKQFGRAIFDWLSDYNDTMENAVRLSAYKAALDKGISKEQAASIAKNLTVNFNRKGQVATQAGALYAFFNAAVQGTTRLAETLKGPAGKKIMAGGLVLGAVQALALAAAGFDDKEPPEFVRERNLVIPLADGKYIAIPLPLGLHVIPNTSRVLTEWALSGWKDPAKRIGQITGAFLDAFNPIGNAGWSVQTIAPTIADPLVALGENRDWTGKPIAKKDRSETAPTPGYTRAKDTASWLSKELAYYLNLATGGTKYKQGLLSPTPDQLDYLIGQATGGIGREVLKAQQSAASQVTGEELPPYKIPLVGRFYGDTKSGAAESNRFYENVTRLNEHEAEIKGRIQNREGGVAEYRREHPEARLVDYANQVERDVQALRQRRRELIEKGASKESVKIQEQRIQAAMKRFNDRVKSAEETATQ